MTVNKKIIIGILIAAVFVFVLVIGWVILQKGKVPPEEIKEEETLKEVLERLTPKEPEPLTEEEKKEQEELLKQLTPTQPKPMTEEEQKEIEELLKQLTP